MINCTDNRRVILLSFGYGIRDPVWCGGKTGGYGLSFTAFNGDIAEPRQLIYAGGGGGHLTCNSDEIVPVTIERIREGFRPRDKDMILIDAKGSLHWDELCKIVDGIIEGLPDYDIAAVSVVDIPGYIGYYPSSL